MSWTKRQLVSKAFGELALVGYEYDLSPEAQQDAGERLEAMVANWLADGIKLPFNFSSDPADIDIDADSGVPIADARTVYSGLAIDISSTAGKQQQLLSSTRRAFNDGYARLLRIAAYPQEQQQPNTMPRGAGNKLWGINDRPFMPTPDTGPLQIADDGGLQFGS